MEYTRFSPDSLPWGVFFFIPALPWPVLSTLSLSLWLPSTIRVDAFLSAYRITTGVQGLVSGEGWKDIWIADSPLARLVKDG